MSAALDDPAVLQDENLIGAGDGVQSMGDHQHRPIGGKGAERTLDCRLRVGVGERRRLVQDEHRGVGEQRPRDRHPLRLPARGIRVLAHHGVVAALEPQDAFVDLRRAGCCLHLPIGGVRPGQTDVVADARAQQLHVLEHEPDFPVQLGRGDLAYVGVADRHRAGLGVVEAGHKLGEGGLPGAGRADESGDGARRAGCGDLSQHPMLAVVAEGDLLEGDFVALWAARRIGECDRWQREELGERLLRLRGVAQELRGGAELHQRTRQAEAQQ